MLLKMIVVIVMMMMTMVTITASVVLVALNDHGNYTDELRPSAFFKRLKRRSKWKHLLLAAR